MSSVAKEWREIPGRYNLEGSKCPICNKVHFPKRSLCPVCRRESLGKMEAYNLSGKGKVYSFSIVHEAPDNCSKLKPYIIAMVETEEGIKITSQIVNVDIDKVEIGMPVRSVLRRLGSDGSDGVIHYGFKFVPDQ